VFVVATVPNHNFMHTWHWQTWNGLPYLTCSLLKDWQHGFFTRSFSPRTPSDLVAVLQPAVPVYRVKQVHGNVVLKTGTVEPLDNLGSQEIPLMEADGLFAENSSEAVWVATADCVPVLIADAQTGKVAAVHAGWRGTAAKIVPEAIAHFQAQGSQLEDLRIGLGPAISGQVYQVSLDVATQLAQSLVCDIGGLEPVYQLPNSPLMTDPEPDKVRLDVRRFNSLQLEQLGITPEQVAIAPYCTYQDPEAFFSYRREQLKRVQWSGIVSQ
jgi:YfiH family protein